MIDRPFTPLPPRSPWRERLSDALDAFYSILFVGGVIAIVALLVCIAFFSLASVAHAADTVGLHQVRAPKTPRDVRVTHEWKRRNPCPAHPERPMGPCVGWRIDHIIPLCLGPERGGVDHVSNLQWQEYHASLAKDREERAQCAALHRAERAQR